MTAMDITSLPEIYQPALLSLAALCLTVLIQALLTAPLAFISGAQTPGAPLRGDHTQRAFRVLRTHANSAENLAPFGLTLLIAMVVGAHASLVNTLAMLHLGFRLLFWLAYYLGVGKVAGGPRTLAYVGGLLTNFALICSTIYTLLSA
ncbi:MAG: MAPEG family protein [Pseudomonadales bacterium]